MGGGWWDPSSPSTRGRARELDPCDTARRRIRPYTRRDGRFPPRAHRHGSSFRSRPFACSSRPSGSRSSGTISRSSSTAAYLPAPSARRSGATSGRRRRPPTTRRAGTTGRSSWSTSGSIAMLFGLSPAGHHLHSVLWHCVAVMLAGALFSGRYGGAGFVGAAVVALHPAQVEVGRVRVRAERSDGRRVRARVRSSRSSAGSWALGGVLALCGLLSKEVVLVLPVLAIVWLAGRVDRRRVLASVVACGAGLGVGLRDAGVPRACRSATCRSSGGAFEGAAHLVGEGALAGRAHVGAPPRVGGRHAVVVARGRSPSARSSRSGAVSLRPIVFFAVALAPALVGVARAGLVSDRYLYLPMVGVGWLVAALLARASDRTLGATGLVVARRGCRVELAAAPHVAQHRRALDGDDPPHAERVRVRLLRESARARRPARRSRAVLRARDPAAAAASTLVLQHRGDPSQAGGPRRAPCARGSARSLPVASDRRRSSGRCRSRTRCPRDGTRPVASPTSFVRRPGGDPTTQVGGGGARCRGAPRRLRADPRRRSRQRRSAARRSSTRSRWSWQSAAIRRTPTP